MGKCKDIKKTRKRSKYSSRAEIIIDMFIEDFSTGQQINEIKSFHMLKEQMFQQFSSMDELELYEHEQECVLMLDGYIERNLTSVAPLNLTVFTALIAAFLGISSLDFIPINIRNTLVYFALALIVVSIFFLNALGIMGDAESHNRMYYSFKKQCIYEYKTLSETTKEHSVEG